jgi:dTDP-4-amino-4,6-dideoxygalactose transaminase
MCAHRELPYASSDGSLLRSEHAQDHSIILPLYTQLRPEELALVVDSLEEAVRLARLAPSGDRRR